MEPEPLQPCEIPTVDDLTTPEQAKEKLDAIRAAAGCDARHAYCNPHHPQHSKMVAAVAELHERYAERPDAHETSTTRACQEALAEADARRDALADACEAEVDALRGLGYEGEAPAAPQPWNLAVLRCQRLLAEGDLAAATPILENELRELRAPAVLKQQLAEATRDPDTLPEVRALVVDKILRWVHAERRKRSGKKPSTTSMEDGE